MEFDFIEELPDEYAQPPFPVIDDQQRQQHEIRPGVGDGQPADSGILTERIAINSHPALSLTAGLASSGNIGSGGQDLLAIPRQDYTEAEKSSALRIINQTGSEMPPQDPGTACLSDSKDGHSMGWKAKQSTTARNKNARPKGLFLSSRQQLQVRSPQANKGPSPPPRQSPDYTNDSLETGFGGMI